MSGKSVETVNRGSIEIPQWHSHKFQKAMRIKGLEPSLLSEPEPKSGASANFAISAF